MHFIAYSDDYCGDDAKIIWTATFTGVVKLVVTKYNCTTGTTNTKVRYRYTAKEAELPNEIMDQEFSVYPNPTNSNVFVMQQLISKKLQKYRFMIQKVHLQLTQKVNDPTVSEIEIGLGELPQGSLLYPY